jgi:hypothetical protein
LKFWEGFSVHDFALWKFGWREYFDIGSSYFTVDLVIFIVKLILVALTGPLYLITAYATVKRRSYKWITIAVVSLMHIHGDLVYFISDFSGNFSILDRSNRYPQLAPYLCGLTVIWLILPAAFLLQVCLAIRFWKVSTMLMLFSNRQYAI